MQGKTRSLIWHQSIKKSTGAIVIVFMLAGFLTALLPAIANAAPESKPPLDCSSCHQKKLELHNKLSSGNKACGVCHDSTDMKVLRLADEAPLPLSDSTRLCAQCHQNRYDAWKEGTHGIPGTVATAKCTTCHNPHQPQIALSNITKPHPAPAPPPPSPPFNALVMLGIVLLLLPIIALALAGTTKGEGP